MAKNDLMNAWLPKWTQMIVTGAAVSEEQALEIIRRTDSFFQYQSGNNHDFIEKAVHITRLPQISMGLDGKAIQRYLAKKEEWREKWGLIETEYVTNSWVSCCYVGGPHGWCHPDGSIGYCDNVGKWPSVEEVHIEWTMLAKEFPFLELEVTLMSGEAEEDFIEPVVSMLIRNGMVELVDPKERNLHKEFGRTKERPKDAEECMRMILFGLDRENAISLEQLKKWSFQVFGE